MENQANVVICPPCGESVAVATKEGQNRKNTLWPLLPRLVAVLPPQGREMSHGFTLIELLVVVLIIGILAAVAVPQYQKVVEKTRATEGIVLTKAIADANTLYYLENGEYGDYIDLSLDIPGTPKTFTNTVHGIQTKYFSCRTRKVDGTQLLGLCNRRIDDNNAYSINFLTDGNKYCSSEGGKGKQICTLLNQNF